MKVKKIIWQTVRIEHKICRYNKASASKGKNEKYFVAKRKYCKSRV